MDTAKRQATERQCELEEELRVLLVHGLLHLIGYDHERSATDLEIVRFVHPVRDDYSTIIYTITAHVLINYHVCFALFSTTTRFIDGKC